MFSKWRRWLILLLILLVVCFWVSSSDQSKLKVVRFVLSNALKKLEVERGFRIVDGVPTYQDFNMAHGRVDIEIPEADATSFQAMRQPANATVLYARDSNTVYFVKWSYLQTLYDADAATFELLTSDGMFARDAKHVYYLGAAIEGADPATFQNLSGAFGKDKNQAYVGVAPIPVKQLSTWKPLQAGTAEDPWQGTARKDKYPRREIEELSASGWSRDATTVYYGNEVAVGADAASFTVLNDVYSKDENHVYGFNKLVDTADPATYVLLEHWYSKDKNHVFFSGEVIPEADPKTFKVHEGPYFPGTTTFKGRVPDAHDATHQFRRGKLFEP